MKNKLKSRKFWICLAEVLLGIGTTITGMHFENEWIVFIGAIMTSVGTGIYTFCEAWVDGKAVNKETV